MDSSQLQYLIWRPSFKRFFHISICRPVRSADISPAVLRTPPSFIQLLMYGSTTLMSSSAAGAEREEDAVGWHHLVRGPHCNQCHRGWPPERTGRPSTVNWSNEFSDERRGKGDGRALSPLCLLLRPRCLRPPAPAASHRMVLIERRRVGEVTRGPCGARRPCQREMQLFFLLLYFRFSSEISAYAWTSEAMSSSLTCKASHYIARGRSNANAADPCMKPSEDWQSQTILQIYIFVNS